MRKLKIKPHSNQNIHNINIYNGDTLSNKSYRILKIIEIRLEKDFAFFFFFVSKSWPLFQVSLVVNKKNVTKQNSQPNMKF